MFGTSRENCRIWFDAIREVPLGVNLFGNHALFVAENPEFFRLNDHQRETIRLQREADTLAGSNSDYNGIILHTVMNNGFVRVRLDPKYLLTGSNIEGMSLWWLNVTARWLIKTFPDMEKLTVVQRFGPGKLDGNVLVYDRNQLRSIR